jgi:valyl-tRNA synthetase
MAPLSKRLSKPWPLCWMGFCDLLHPFMPHITEEVWHTLNQVGEDQSLAVQQYPAVYASAINPQLEADFDLLIGTLRTIRNLRAEAGIKPSAQIEAILQSANPKERQILQAGRAYVEAIGRVEQLTIRGEGESSTGATSAPKAPSSGAAQPLSNTAGGSAVDSVEGIKAEIIDFWVTMRPLLEEPLTYLQRFFSDFRRPATTLGVLFALFIALQILSAVLQTLDSIVLIGPLLKLIGMGYTAWFVAQNLLYAHKRQQTWSKVDHWRKEIVGEAKDWLERQTVTPTTTAQTVAQEVADLAERQAESPVAPATEPAIAPEIKLFAGVVGTVQVLIPLTGLVDVDALRAKIEKDLSKVEGEIKSLNGRLSNPGFVNKAPEDVVQGARDALAEAETQAAILKSRLERL